jgi:starch synthase
MRQKTKKLSVLFSASEAALLAKVGGLGDVIESLPKALRALGVDARIILPRYQMIDVASLRSIKTMTVAVGDTAEPVTIYEGVVPGSTTPV